MAKEVKKKEVVAEKMEVLGQKEFVDILKVELHTALETPMTAIATETILRAMSGCIKALILNQKKGVKLPGVGVLYPKVKPARSGVVKLGDGKEKKYDTDAELVVGFRRVKSKKETIAP